MKKNIIYALLAAMALTLSACGQDKDGKNELPTGSKIETDFGTVTLCDYSNITADEIVYEITEDDVTEEVDNLLYDYIQYVEKESAEDGDYVEVYMTGTVDGELLYDFSEEEGDTYDILLGYNEFGEEFDAKLLGASAGDELSFSIAYGDDYGDDELAGMTVDYSVNVVSVLEEILPEMTEEFVTGTLGYASEEEMRAEIKEELNAYYNSDTAYYAKEELLQKVVENSKFGDYSKDLYQNVKAEVESSYEGYMEWLGVSTLDEVYGAFEMDEEDVEEEVLNQVYRTITVYAIAKEQGIELSDAEYQAGLQEYVQMYTDYYAEEFTADRLISEFGEESLRYWILEDKVLDYLYDHAVITQVVGSLDADSEMVEEMTEE